LGIRRRERRRELEKQRKELQYVSGKGVIASVIILASV
jgi:hypothetical protein